MDVIQAMQERRSVNYFAPDKPLETGKLDKVLQLANLSPSSFDLQPWRLIIVDDPVKKKILRSCAFNQPKVEEASAVLILIADPGALELNLDRMLDSWQKLGYIKDEGQKQTYKGMAGQLYGEPNSEKRRYFAIKNTGLFAMNIMLAAQGLGLNTHPMDGFDEACIKKEFNIPGDKIIPMLIAVGYFNQQKTLLPRAFRRDVKEFTGYNSYK